MPIYIEWAGFYLALNISKESLSGEKEEKADNKADLKFAQCDKTNFS